jgi:hypothetical protein
MARIDSVLVESGWCPSRRLARQIEGAFLGKRTELRHTRWWRSSRPTCESAIGRLRLMADAVKMLPVLFGAIVLL